MTETREPAEYVIFRLREAHPVAVGGEVVKVWLPDSTIKAASREDAIDAYVDAIERADPPEDMNGVPVKAISLRHWDPTSTIKYDRVRRIT